MLKKLIVKNLAVVESAVIDFASGLNVITGETGAGKSVLMGALDLVLGGRAEASVVRDGAKEAEIEAVFDDGSVRRTVTAQGRSRAWIDDESVTVLELRERVARRVDIHGPAVNQKLTEESFQRETLDAYGSVDAECYRAAYAAREHLAARISELEQASGDTDEEDFLRFQVNELEAADLSDEDKTLQERHASAAHAEEIIENANAVTEALGGDRSAAEILIALQPRLREMAKHLPTATEWLAEAEELTGRVQGLSRAVADAALAIDVGEEDLAELDARLTLVNRLIRKHHVPDVSELLVLLEAKRKRLDELEHRKERLEELNVQFAAADREVRAAGAGLTRQRKAAAEKMAKCVTKELKDLGFLQAKFFVSLEPGEPESHGMDRIVYMFEPNPGETARSLAAVASSGEIARVMLALKVVTARSVRTTETLVFDEIDANIGGEVGKVVGEKLRAVARQHQVIAITHLPQTAVCGERHLVVKKGVSGGRTRTVVSVVEGKARVSEVARMLGGEKLTSVVKRHAEEMLQLSS